MQSRFRFYAYMPAFLVVFITGFLVLTIYLVSDSPTVSFPALLAIFSIWIFILVWVAYGELRTKAIRVDIGEYEIIVSRYLGLGSNKVYYFSSFDGYETAILSSRYSSYEFLYLVANGKRVIKLSEYYHKNYTEMKKVLSEKLPDLGHKPFNFFQELKEIFV